MQKLYQFNYSNSELKC